MVLRTWVRRSERLVLDELDKLDKLDKEGSVGERVGGRGGLLRPLVVRLVGNVVAQLHLERGVEELAV